MLKLWRVYQTPVRSGTVPAAGSQVPVLPTTTQVSPTGQVPQIGWHWQTCAVPEPVQTQVSPLGQVALGLFGSQLGLVGGTQLPLTQT